MIYCGDVHNVQLRYTVENMCRLISIQIIPMLYDVYVDMD